MHPRNPYRTPPDFSSLAESYPSLKSRLLTTPAGGITIDFKDELSQRLLTEALLYRDFNLSLSLPPDRLCPPIPNRLNYVLWLQDILQVTSGNPSQGVSRGIDIGTGASAIYPMLACRLNEDWTLVGTEIDSRSLQYARENVRRNDLVRRIEIVEAASDGPVLLPLTSNPASTYDFTMCNPPFYASTEEIKRSAESKEFQPNAVCTGAAVEMITTGGEVTFVCNMVRESVVLRERCRWYTSMLGKASSLSEVVDLIRSHKIDNHAITEFVQGQTRRWAIGWSFGDIRLPDSLARISNPALRHLMPTHTNLREPLPSPPHPTTLFDLLSSIPGIAVSETTTTTNAPAVTCSASANTWSRAARRKLDSAPTPSSTHPLLVCLVSVFQDDKGVALGFAWIRGRDRASFESFCSHVGRKVRDAIRPTD